MVYYLGVDLGQKQDPTALALVRRMEYRCARDAVDGWPKRDYGGGARCAGRLVSRDAGRSDLFQQLVEVFEARGKDDPACQLYRSQIELSQGDADAAQPLGFQMLHCHRNRGEHDAYMTAEKIGDRPGLRQVIDMQTELNATDV